jgi:hypothetical protein
MEDTSELERKERARPGRVAEATRLVQAAEAPSRVLREGGWPLVIASTLLMGSTIWGICFSLEANSNDSNERSFDTVLPRFD